MGEAARRKRITLADVAKEAGVSVQTASHVLSENMTVRLPAATRERVQEAAAKVGYRPNRLAQAMKRGKTQMIAVWMPVDRPILTYLRFLQAINAKVRVNGYDLMIVGLDGSAAFGSEGRVPNTWPVDGIISVDAGKAIQVFRSDPSNDHIPTVILGFEEFKNSDSVTWDVAGAMREATERLIARGAKRIAMVTLDWILRDYPREMRRRGYSEAMTAAGLEVEFVPVAGESSSAATEAVTQYLDHHEAPDAFVSVTDTVAIGTVRAVTGKGIQVPGQCMVWGFGDFPESEDYRIPISSIRIPISNIVDKAWTWLSERIDDPGLASRFELLPMELIERESTFRPS
ncbi:MAG: LacI family transcriptional regulator [Fimbriimonadaceae bacterium]|nr:LacI family transcriptional regulator [Fimbriimonadaceae bacterium]